MFFSTIFRTKSNKSPKDLNSYLLDNSRDSHTKINKQVSVHFNDIKYNLYSSTRAGTGHGHRTGLGGGVALGLLVYNIKMYGMKII